MIYTDIYRPENTRYDGIDVIRVAGVRDFDIAKTFDCGQCFRFEPVADTRHEAEFSGIAYGKAVSFASDGDTLYIYNSDEDDYNNIWRRYLGLDTDYDMICDDILSRSDNPALEQAVITGRGIHILRQEPWETVCSFIISQNNNIPRIKKIINAMCMKYGEEIVCKGMEKHGICGNGYSFPDAETVFRAGTDGIFALKTGFRAKYIADAAKKCTDGTVNLGILDKIDKQSASENLKTICGIGDKVAACSLLFGFGHLDAFPVDVWIKKVITKYFGADFTPQSLGPYAGVAQQFLFYYERWLGGAE